MTAVPVLKRMTKVLWFRKTIAIVVAEYLRLVWNTTRIVVEPHDINERALSVAPMIVAMWHGQHFLTPFLVTQHPTKVLISRHSDGDINAMAAEHLGVQLIRGSGAQGGEFRRKGGVSAFYEMLDALKQGYNVALTADVPKISRVAGRGIANLALISGRPVFVVAVATRNRIAIKSWDRATLSLPFGRGAVVGAGPIPLPPVTDEFAIEKLRQSIELALNAVTERAYEIVDGPLQAQASRRISDPKSKSGPLAP
jgi:lysophospholipid acyltransferase (LPLAT)-like uncharacterized protein